MNTLMIRLRNSVAGLALAGSIALPANGQTQMAAATVPRAGASSQETIGVLTGLAVGALAAGPFGAIAGAAAGAWLGERYHHQLHEQKQLAQHTRELDTALTQEQRRARGLEDALGRADEIEADVGFRTNDDSIAVFAMGPLLKLASLAAAMPGVRVHVEGFADPRGSDRLNDALSARRAEAVAAVLASAGLPPDRLLVEAHGKSVATSGAGDLDGFAFDRRVTVKIEKVPGRLASNP